MSSGKIIINDIKSITTADEEENADDVRIEQIYHLDFNQLCEFQTKYPNIYNDIKQNQNKYFNPMMNSMNPITTTTESNIIFKPMVVSTTSTSKLQPTSLLKNNTQNKFNRTNNKDHQGDNNKNKKHATSDVNNVKINQQVTGGKSVLVTYIFWLFGGLFGAHHFYLRRDKQAFLWATTFGGYFGIGWLGDVFKIKRYVQDANDDPIFIQYFIQQLQKYKKPPFSTNRFIGQLMVGYFWAQLVLLAVPGEEFGGINWKFLNWLSPLACGLGVWFVGNIGRQKGTPWMAILAAYVAYQSRWYIYDETTWLTIISFSSALAFDTFSKEWNREPPKRHGFIRRVIVLSICFTLYMSLWGSYLYFNGKITDSDGEEIPVYEAINHFFRSPWWTDIKSALFEIWDYAQHHGWYEIWKQIIEISDPSGENNAYRVLDVSPESSQTEITAKWRKLSKEWHPDKVKDEDQKRAAQEKFMEIQQAYEILSKVKNKRQRRNKQSV